MLFIFARENFFDFLVCVEFFANFFSDVEMHAFLVGYFCEGKCVSFLRLREILQKLLLLRRKAQNITHFFDFYICKEFFDFLSPPYLGPFGSTWEHTSQNGRICITGGGGGVTAKIGGGGAPTQFSHESIKNHLVLLEKKGNLWEWRGSMPNWFSENFYHGNKL